jgi:APA family basic amino acid/polyamine antiporter
MQCAGGECPKGDFMNEEKGKKLNILNIIGLGLGGAIGTGIFVLLGAGIKYTGRSIIWVVIIGCFFMLLAYWYNLAMPSIFVLKGGDYSMKAMLFNPLMTGVGGWMTIVNAFAMSSYAIAITSYLMVVFPKIEAYQQLCSFIIITVFFISTIKGSRFVTILENLVTIVLIAALALFVLFGIPHVNPIEFFNPTADGGFFHGGFSGFVSAIAVMGWACQGTTMAPVSMAAVTEKPKRTIPVGIIIITALLAVVYGLMAYVAGGVLPYEKIAGANLSVTAEAIFPKSLYAFFVIGGGIGAIASSLLGGLAMFRYPLIHIAEDGWLPAVFKKTTKSGYPYLTYLVFYLVSVFPIVTGMSLDAAVSLVMIPSMLMNMYMNIACMTLPKTYPNQWKDRSIKMGVGFYNVCCVLGAFCAGVVAFNLFKDLNMQNAIVCVIILVALVGLSLWRLKIGAVNVDYLKEQKKKIVAEALLDDVD